MTWSQLGPSSTGHNQVAVANDDPVATAARSDRN